MPKNTKDVYQIVTDKIVELLEQGTVPWQRPWRTSGASMPRSLSTKKPYRGVNVFLLAATAMQNGYTSPWWGTFKQIRDRGGSVRKGERATLVTFWSILKKKEENDAGEEKTKRIFFLRYYNVFNADQCDGLDEFKATDEVEEPEFEPVDLAEEIVATMPLRPSIHHRGERAFYRFSDDSVTMPKRESFRSPEAYYATLFHELGHATGHESRLNRHADEEYVHHKFGDPNYSREELVAEMTSAFLCGTVGIDTESGMANSAAYVQSWIRTLKGDKRLIVSAAARAQKASDFILGGIAEDEAEITEGVASAA